MNIDIENVNTIEKRQNSYTERCRTVYEVIQQHFFNETGIFPDNFINHFNNNMNEARNISIEVKNNIKLMSMEQELYANVSILCQNYLKTNTQHEDRKSVVLCVCIHKHTT